MNDHGELLGSGAPLRCASSFWGAVFLTTGNMVGVGLLALPVLLGLAGFGPGIVAILGVAALVWSSGALLAERVIIRHKPDADLLSIYQADLGPGIRVLVFPVYLFIFYALQIAYLAGSASTLHELLHTPVPLKAWMLLVAIIAVSGVVFGQTALLRWNGRIVLIMLALFIILLAFSSSQVDIRLLSCSRWRVLPATLPVLCCAFAYHNVIPLVCRELQWNRRAVHLSLSTGLLLAVTMSVLWFGMVAGSLPLADVAGGPSILAAYEKGLPATVPLTELLGRPAIGIMGLLFSLLAILTSYWAIGGAMCSFLHDALPPLRGPWLFAATFLPPLVLAWLHPDIFLEMVGAVGGIGMIFLFGFLPVLAYLRGGAARSKWRKAVLSAILLLFLAIFVIEAGRELRLWSLDTEQGLVTTSRAKMVWRSTVLLIKKEHI